MFQGMRTYQSNEHVSMTAEQANNPVFVGNCEPPFRLAHRQPIHKGRILFGAMQVVAGRLLVTRAGGYLACIDPLTREIQWELERDQLPIINTTGREGRLFAAFEDGFARLDLSSGEVIWQSAGPGQIRAICGDRLLVMDETIEPQTLRCVDVDQDEPRWTLPRHRDVFANDVETNLLWFESAK